MAPKSSALTMLVQYLLCCLWLRTAAAARLRVPGPYNRFHTEPDFIPSEIHVYREPTDMSEIEPGYIFIAPHVANKGYGPQIVAMNGDLIWYGLGTVNKFQGRKTYAMNLYVCDYKGQKGNHLCYSEARPEGHDVGIRTAGANRVFNASYHQVGPDYGIAGNFTFPNPHEFNMLPNGESFLQAVYKFHKMNLRPYAGKNPGFVFSGCFQEVHVRSGKELFRWCFLDHHPIWNTHIFLHNEENTENVSSPVGGTGVRNDPWDFMHLNAVDKNEEGDYLVSGRHLNSVLKIAGPDSRSGLAPGTTIWRVGGEYSDFEMESEESGAHFSMQHHCRFVKTTKNETTITLFNNANNGITAPSSNYSSAIVFTVNNRTMKARLDHIYKQPQSRLAYAQGSMQILPNSNAMVGWGAKPQWSEFSQNGTLLYHAGAHADANGRLSNYRTYKFPWVGKPKTKPKLIAYSQTCEFTEDKTSPLVAYASWNGATEVTHWRFLMSYTDRSGPWFSVGTFEKKGFETRARLSSTIFTKTARWAPYVAVEALDKNGKVLSRAYRKTFVPSRKVKHLCDHWGCKMPNGLGFYYAKANNRADSCSLKDYQWLPQALMLIVAMLAIECVDYLLVSYFLPQWTEIYLPRRHGKYMYALNGKHGDA